MRQESLHGFFLVENLFYRNEFVYLFVAIANINLNLSGLVQVKQNRTITWQKVSRSKFKDRVGGSANCFYKKVNIKNLSMTEYEQT